MEKIEEQKTPESVLIENLKEGIKNYIGNQEVHFDWLDVIHFLFKPQNRVALESLYMLLRDTL